MIPRPRTELLVGLGTVGILAMLGYGLAQVSKKDLPRRVPVKFAICDTRTDGTLRCVRCSMGDDCPPDAWVLMMHEKDVTSP